MRFCCPWLERNPLAESLLVLDPPGHTRLRATVSHAFAPPAMARLEQRVRAIARELADNLAEQRHVDFMTAFAGPLPARIMAEILGLDSSLHVHFKRWTDDVAAISPAIVDPDRIATIQATMREMEAYFGEVIATRRRRPGGDMISSLISIAAQEGPLSDAELMAFLFVLLAAGLETTMYFLANALLTLTARPHDRARLAADRGEIPSFLEEVLRHDSPGHGTFRIVTDPVELAGTALSPGDVLLLLMASSNRDEQKFPDAATFDMDRAYDKALAFGYGIHFCLGAPLARLEARVALEELVARFQKFSAPCGVVAWNQSLTVRGPVSLPVEFVPRN
ncbi:cytochrome P450 [Bradyrhizobium sp. BR 1432]|uniref:cytochrome P450 n=1 Tax=Bradyrhizobium sp. BR 1432 TaxID=3447966 RepID=UPI003EE6D36A